MKLAAMALAAIGILLAPDPPAAPTGVSATPGASQIALDWNDVSQVDGYNVWRAPYSGGPLTKINPTLLATSAYTNTGLDPGTRYFYVVRAQNASGESGNSAEVSAIPTGTDTVAPLAPTISSVTRKTRDTTPSTSGMAEPGTTVRVYSGSTEIGSTTAAMNGTWTVANPSALGSDGVYSITARATDSATNQSPPSSAIQVTLDTAAPLPPTNVVTTAYHNCVDVEWTASPSSDVAGYKVERKTGAGSWTLLHSNLVVGTKYRDSTASNGTTYLYRVIAVDNSLDN